MHFRQILNELEQADFPLVYSLACGAAGWHRAGLPVISGDTLQTSIRLTEIVGLH